MIGVITAVGCYMLYQNAVLPLTAEPSDFRPLILAGILALLYFGSRKVMKKGLSPILLIGISACLGIVFFGF